MTVLLTLVTAGVDSGPFDLYSNLDSYAIPFEVGVSKAALQGGYTTALVPDYTSTVRVKSTGICINFVDIPLTVNSFLHSLTTGVDCIAACGSSVIKTFNIT